MAVTTATRTLLDLGAVVDEATLELAFEDALRRRLTSLPRLAWALRSPARGRRGVAALRRLVESREAGQKATESGLETSVAATLRSLGFPSPVRQYVVRDGREFVARIDLAYPEAKIAIEVDSYRWHSSREAWSADRVKGDRLTALGWRLVHATKRDLDEGCKRLARDLRRLIGQQALFPGRDDGTSERRPR